MKKVKYYLIPLITSFLMFLNCVPVHAEGYYTLIDFKEDTEEYITGGGLAYDATSALKNWVHRGFQSVGFLINEVQDTLGIKRAINQVDSTIDDNSSDEDVNNWIRNNLTVSGNNVEFSNDLRQSIYNYAEDYSKSNLVYCYSYGLFEVSGNNYLPKNTGVFRSVGQYEKALELIKGPMPLDVINYDKNYVWWLNNPSSGYQYLYKFSLVDHPYLVFKNATGGANPTGSKTAVMFINSLDNTLLQPADACYRWNGTSGEWELQESAAYNNGTVKNIGLSFNPKRDSNDYSVIINYISREYRWFSYSSSLSPQDVMTQPYYYNQDVWQDFSSTTGDYIVTDENINTVSYGDTISYINSFNTENGYPPTSSDININIENKNDENKNPSGGGGSGGSGDDSGGGSGGSGDGIGSIGDIFGFLKQLGAVIASLIKGLGDFVAEIVGGLAEAISSLIESISSLITNLHSSMSSAFFDIIGDLFEWMPTEWKDLMTYAFTIMILIAVIKFIRG